MPTAATLSASKGIGATAGHEGGDMGAVAY